MPAVSMLSVRARTFVVALLLALVAAPLAGAVRPAPAAAAGFGQMVIDEAARHYGKPYSYGAVGPDSFDCSGFTGYVYRQFGVALPRTSRDQYAAIPHVRQDQKEIGDLIFTYDSGGIYHVAIYAGNNTTWAATHTGDIVRTSSIWTSSYVVGRPVTGGAIGRKWSDLGGSYGFLGQPLDLEHSVTGGRKINYSGGDIYWSSGTGAHEVHAGIRGVYDRVGGSGSVLGLPTSDEHAVTRGRANTFVRGAIYWGPSTGSHPVYGAIWSKYASLGGSASVIGLPAADETAVTGGRRQAYAWGELYWSSGTGAHPVYGAIGRAYLGLGGAAGKLGLPTSDERTVTGGRETSFQHGRLRWSSSTGAVTLLAL